MWCDPPGGRRAPLALLITAMMAFTNVFADDESMGPVFIKEPPNRIDFSNGTGAVVECQARGNPQPDIIWVRTSDGTAVGDVPGLRQVLPNGNLVFPPFRAEDYRQEVHAQVYSCLARSPAGSVHSRDVNVRAVVSQYYVTEAENEYVIRGNSAIMKCKIPSFVSEFLFVDQWTADDGSIYTTGTEYDGKYLVLPSGELHIKDVGPEDGYKTYQCRTKHRLTGETRLSATKGRLVITEPVSSSRPKLSGTSDLQRFTVSLNKQTTLLCPAQGFPVPSYRWYKFIDGTSRRHPVQLNERVRQVSGTLIIREARVDDSGKYLCVVNNSVGGESVETVLTVTAPLAAEIEPRTQTIDFGRPAKFVCNFEGNPIKTISWLKDGKPLQFEESILTIDAVKKEDKGMYQCFVRNDQESAQATAELKLGGRFEPPQIRQTFPEETLQPGPSVFLKCVASGNPTPEITWELDGKRLSNTDRLQVGQYVTVNGDVFSQLNISSIHTNDGGMYKCIAASKVGSAEHSARLNVYGLPFIRHMDKKAIVAGETLRVTCPVAGYPIETIVWERDSRVLPINRKQKVFANGTLIIENVERMSDQATYTCVARNAQGYSARGTLEVQVMVAPQIGPFSFGDESINAGDMASVQCAVIKGDLPLEISWAFKGQPIRPDQLDIAVSSSGKRLKQLTIESVAARHAGEYTCIASNKAGSTSHSATLDVNVPPRWILEPTDKAFAQGSDARVECKADGFPRPQVTWKRAAGETPGDYKDLKLSNPDISIEDGTLSINNIQKTNEGYYLCEAVNGIGAGLSAVILISVQAPPQFEIKLRNQTARRGEPAVLQCEAQGEKPIGILWNMNNKRLDPKSDARYTIREEILANGVLSDLSIKRTERTDSALFTCVATNAFGSDDTSINMIVQEVPEVPYGLKVLDKSGRSVQLSWAAPYDGNSPIKRYLIEYKISKGSWENDIDKVLVPGSQQNVAGVFNLRPATTYHLRIVAENEIGASDPSDTVTIITAEEAPSGPPSSVRVDALDQHTLKVTWKPPPREDWNGEILGYYVGYKLSSADKPFMFETVEFSKEDGKEHHLQIMNLKTYTQYSVVVQAFNKVGAGPMSEERRQHTAEGVPEQPPHDTTCTTLTAQTVRVSWVSPPLSAANGVITGYKVIYGPSDSWYDENSKDTKITSSSETILHGLKKYTNYSMHVLAFTSGGDGVKSAPIHCQTEQDVPEAPVAIKALVMSAESILISWRPPSQPNGVISQYTVYAKAENREEPTTQKVLPNQLTHEATGLDKQYRYDFWVTASTNIGEGQASKIVTLSPSTRVPAKIASFDDKFTATYKEDVKLPCLAVGVPAPEVTWKVRGATLEPSDRLRQLPEGFLFIKEVDRADAGEYACYVENSFGHDTVTHQLVVHAPPHSPQVTLTATTTNSLTMKLRPHPTDNAPLQGYTIHYKPEFGELKTVQVSSTAQKYTLENLWCGSRYQIYVTAYNGIGTGDRSDILNTRTKGSKPIIPEAARFIEVSTNSITLHLSAWSDGGCPMLYFVVEHKKKLQQEWNQVSNNVKPGGNFVVLDLDPASWYHLRVTAHNDAGFAVAEYEFATLTVTGGTIAPPVRETGTENTDVRRYFPWLPSWLDVNVVVPVAATVVVIIVGIVVICVALSRRTRGPEQTRLRDDVVYQQTGVVGATLDKRRPDLRDELGYIAPPNRKLPPVPGSNYNTCDRIKRGTVISGTGSLRSHSTWDPRRNMYEELTHCAPNRRCPPPPHMGSAEGLSHRGMEDEICPYATFHLLGFREEMDPNKAMQFQTFPHPANGHSGTMGPPSSHPTNASAHSRSGSQSMPRQNGRYSRVPSQGGGPHNMFSPEYDDPANCAPEEDQYGSQYGQYGAPYDHYGSRGSVGRRSVGSARNLPMSGSPEPPPPPPRNHDPNNSSFNDSKESNEISEAECDRDQIINRNYGVNARSKDGMTTEEMRKLIERKPNEATGRQTSGPPGSHGGLLTPYDTVAV
ncbi:Down syndrome cell adhesion molecule-like protein Dscam2 isoform X10 [Neodiprion virginianus]|uniref:Down syndrome cell adhesion molecule-like protein Dscam2 isoform X9 n=1 Tax=Neodiprion lecontei TaxID=441921 RepID=A0ABM3FT43_NEOLC|nr:Down syndrome cell adhesion molecule-like protein Dscam2 isoform X10 [Neodiprion fabricii]XP_046473841.1 Down syndrome cell adhesion molecule-like protein Dscam2 isoform X9 [Neodiprion pinetum]XP_046591192.1 Down syndrome cell adhesion molecule-like protein Dscam2 isoform X9 [Neodiprion lecontei]XP_046611586.1 Down syndrome cell adhesion molecule-like protein Dscam2 isoform X10 [Neodiprion virginianus]